MDWMERITAIADLRGVSGREHRAAEAVCAQLRAYAPDAVCKDGTVIGHIGTDSEKPLLMMCAHLDQVGFFVTDITAEGFLRIGAVGGIDRRLLLGQAVVVMGKTPVFGVISILPPHLLQGDQAVPTDATLCVDLGYASAEAVQAVVQLGDAVCFATTCKPLQGNRMTGSALDNRCGVAAILGAAELLAQDSETLPCRVAIVCSAQEERGSRGAILAAQTEASDYAIAVDVTFATAHDDSGTGCMTLGKGPAIGISSVLDAALSQVLLETAKAEQIPCQIEVMPDGTGTDADHLALSPNGAAAATVSIPLRYMHTPVEVIDCADVAATAMLLAAYARRCGA